MLGVLKHLVWSVLSKVAETASSAALYSLQRNGAPASWPVFKFLPIISQPISTATASSFLLLESCPVRLSLLLPKQATCFLLPCICMLFPLSEWPSLSLPEHMLSRIQRDNSQAKKQWLGSRRWSQLEYKVKEILIQMTQSLVPTGSWMLEEPVEEREPGEMSLQPVPTLRLNSSKRKARWKHVQQNYTCSFLNTVLRFNRRERLFWFEFLSFLDTIFSWKLGHLNYLLIVQICR